MKVREFLTKYFEEKKKIQQSYSLRDLAADIGVGKTTLSEIIAGKRDPSQKNMELILKVVTNSDSEVQEVLQDRNSENQKRRLKYRTVQGDSFSLISDWEYLAILNLAKIKENNSSIKWISKKLNITQERATECVNDLIANEYLSVSHGKLTRLTGPLSSTTEVDNQDIKKHHSQSLNLAEDALYSTQVELREFLSGHIAIRAEDIPSAKEEIFEFYKRFAKRYDRLENADSLYKINIQFFPLGTST